jgi:hypothetical protein
LADAEVVGGVELKYSSKRLDERDGVGVWLEVVTGSGRMDQLPGTTIFPQTDEGDATFIAKHTKRMRSPHF